MTDPKPKRAPVLPQRTDSYSVLQTAIEKLKAAIEDRARLIAKYKTGLKAYDEDIEGRRERVLYAKVEHDHYLKLMMADVAEAMGHNPEVGADEQDLPVPGELVALMDKTDAKRAEMIAEADEKAAASKLLRQTLEADTKKSD